MKQMGKHEQNGKASRCAFTLVEVVVATALMILTLAAFIGAFVMAKKSAVISENRLETVHDARSQMEKLLVCPYLDSRLNVGAHTTEMAGVRYGVVVITNSQYTVKNISMTSTWVNPANTITSIVVLTGSMSSELHQ